MYPSRVRSRSQRRTIGRLLEGIATSQQRSTLRQIAASNDWTAFTPLLTDNWSQPILSLDINISVHGFSWFRHHSANYGFGRAGLTLI